MLYYQLVKLFPLNCITKNGLMNEMSVKIASFPYKNYQRFLDKLNQPIKNTNYETKPNFNSKKMYNYLKIICQVVTGSN